MSDVDLLCVNTLRFLSVDAVERAKSGHPGLPLGAAPMAYVLWDRHLRHNPADPQWWNRDRFVLSAGHGSALLYSLLHMTGYDLSIEDLRGFRQLGSRTPGHPEHGHTPGVEATTGPLGQGFAMGIGMAIAEHHLAARFNREGFPLVDHYTYGLVSDGDLMEGIASEAASLAGHLRLGKLLYLYDNNQVSLEGRTSLSFTEDVAARFSSYGWGVKSVADGNDLDMIDRAIASAKEDPSRPWLISVHTHIGYGSPRQDTHQAHGEPLGPEGTRSTKTKLGWPLEPTFLVPEAARDHMRQALKRGAESQETWSRAFRDYRQAHPEDARLFEQEMRGELPPDWGSSLPPLRPAGTPMATRDASSEAMNSLAKALPRLLGGSGDLSPSTKTYLAGAGDFEAGHRGGRNVHFGVREHAMMAAVNGMALHGGVLPYGATFLVFSDYARPAIRLAALMQTHALFVFTHDSVEVGEDGPTHQPVEQVMSLRAIPGLTVLRPADANEVMAAWRVLVERPGPSALVLTRQRVPVLAETAARASPGVAQGAYILSDTLAGDPRAILIATGSEVPLALEAQRALSQEGMATRVVSMPSWELFEEQGAAYRNSVLPPDIPRISIEAGVTLGWSRYVGPDGQSIGVDRFGASAPGPQVSQHVGLTVAHVMQAVRTALQTRT